MIFLCDVDGVVADLLTVWLVRYYEITGIRIRPEEVKSWDFRENNLLRKIFFGILYEPNLYDRVLPIPDARDGVAFLRMLGHRVVFVTSSTSSTAGQKMLWLAKHGFVGEKEYGDIIVALDKSLIKGDVLIDDHLDNLMGFEGARILFDQPHNRKFVERDFVRLRSWKDIVRHFTGGTHGTHRT